MVHNVLIKMKTRINAAPAVKELIHIPGCLTTCISNHGPGDMLQLSGERLILCERSIVQRVLAVRHVFNLCFFIYYFNYKPVTDRGINTALCVAT